MKFYSKLLTSIIFLFLYFTHISSASEMHLVEKLLDTESGWHQFWQLRRNLDNDPNHMKFIVLGERFGSFEGFLGKAQAAQNATVDHLYKLNINELSGIYLLYANLKAKEALNPCGFF